MKGGPAQSLPASWQIVTLGASVGLNVPVVVGAFTIGGRKKKCALPSTQGLVTLIIVRVFLIPFLHATLTSMTGIGLAVGRLNKGFLRYGGPVLGYSFDPMTHALLTAGLGLRRGSSAQVRLVIEKEWH